MEQQDREGTGVSLVSMGKYINQYGYDCAALVHTIAKLSGADPVEIRELATSVARETPHTTLQILRLIEWDVLEGKTLDACLPHMRRNVSNL